MLRLYVVIFFLLVTACASPTLNNLKNLERIANGQPPSNFSFEQSIVNGVPVDKDSDYGQRTALLMMEKPGGPTLCTAVPIGSQLLLTAAHCVYQLKSEQLKVVFANDQVLVEKFKVHESYDGTPQSYSDLAILKLKSTLPADTKIVPTYDGRDSSFDDQLVLTGYGITDEHSKDSLILRMTTKSFKRDVFIKNSLIGFNQKNATGGFCKGDSGAPIFVKQGSTIKLIGVNSFTAGTGEALDCRTASFAMYIPYFRNWIIKESIKL